MLTHDPPSRRSGTCCSRGRCGICPARATSASRSSRHRWQAARVLRWYELDATGKRCWNRVHDTDPKGRGKIAERRGDRRSPSSGARCASRGWATGGEIYACSMGGCSLRVGVRVLPRRTDGACPRARPASVALGADRSRVGGADGQHMGGACTRSSPRTRARPRSWLNLDAGRTLVYWRDRRRREDRARDGVGRHPDRTADHPRGDGRATGVDAGAARARARAGPSSRTSRRWTAGRTSPGTPRCSAAAPCRSCSATGCVDGHWQPAPAAPRVLFLGEQPPVTPREDMTREELRPLIEHVYQGHALDAGRPDPRRHGGPHGLPWPKVWRLFLNLPWDPIAETSWMPPDTWAALAGAVALDRTGARVHVRPHRARPSARRGGDRPGAGRRRSPRPAEQGGPAHARHR